MAGIGTMLLWENVQPNQQTQRPEGPEQHAVKPPEKQPAAAPTQPDTPPTLVELEWRAFDSRDKRAALFFEVAQRYFDANDLDSAVRCYRQAFDASPKEDLAIRPDDNWLVMALKEARQKENDNAILIP
jgi:hypothetical protein